MNKLEQSDLLPLERYATERRAFRARVMAHKRPRAVELGKHVRLLFEDRLTVQYQVQEMLRIERIFESAGIQDELDAYNPLIPDGKNLKATMLLEFTDAAERARQLAGLVGIEHRIFAEVDGHPRIFARADEDIDRSNSEKTSAVHFLRFEFPAQAMLALKSGASLSMGIDDSRLREQTRVDVSVAAAIAQDLTG